MVELRAGMKISLILAWTVRMGLLRRGHLARKDERDCVGREGEGEREKEKDTEALERGSLARRAIGRRERVSFLCLRLCVRVLREWEGKEIRGRCRGRRRRGGELVGI
jgi:hypothetical protein